MWANPVEFENTAASTTTIDTDKREPRPNQRSHYDIAAFTKSDDQHVVILASSKSNRSMMASRYSLLMIEQRAMLASSCLSCPHRRANFFTTAR